MDSVSRPFSVRSEALVRHEADFHEVMAEQLRRAPWLLLSLVIHGIAVLVLLLLPAAEVQREMASVGVQNTQPPEIVEPEPVKPPELQKETPVDPTLSETVDPEPNEVSDESDPRDLTPSTASAFRDNQWNKALGLAGGAAGVYGNRPGGGGRGGPGSFQPETRRALEWLARHQDDDGRWDCDGFMKHDREGALCDGPGNAVHDVGVTGLAMLAFLGDGSTLRHGPFQANLKRAVRWLLSEQRDNGLFGQNASHDFVYDHAIAAYAMAEAYGLSSYVTLRDPAQRAINYLESHRNPYAVWRYQPRDNDNDASVTGWCIMAYESGRNFGLQVSDQALRTSLVWLDQVTTPDGRCGYTKASEPSSRRPGDHGTRFPVSKGEALTAVGLFCRAFLGQDPREVPVMKEAARRLVEKPPVWDVPSGAIDHYYWYYGTYALYQMGGNEWRDWSRTLGPALQKNQRRDGNFAGSWDPVGAWGDDGGRVYATAILALTLEANYRYVRLIR